MLASATASSKRKSRPRTGSWSGDEGITWTIPSPVTRNTGTYALKHVSQPGSRIWYIDPVSGSTASTNGTILDQAMFWDGTNIIDATGSTTGSGGVAYGTDPLNPTGPVNTVRYWAQVGPRGNGDDVGTTTGTIGAINPGAMARDGFADFYLIKRGTTLDMVNDKAAWDALTGGSQAWHGLNIHSGAGVGQVAVCGAYGPTSTARPVIKRHFSADYGFVGRFTAGRNHYLYTGLKFDGSDRSQSVTVGGLFFASANAETNQRFEDCWWFACGTHITIGDGATNTKPANGSWRGKLAFVGCLITDTWQAASRIQGMYFSGRAYEGRLELRSTILIRNGYGADPTTKTSFMPDGVEWSHNGDAAGNRNLYLSGASDPSNSTITDCVSICGPSGDQVRPGMAVTKNFFYGGYMGHGACSGYSDNTTTSGAMTDNVLQRLKGSGGGLPGWGYIFGGGHYGTEFKRNIFTSAQDGTTDASGAGFGLELKAIWNDTDQPFNRGTTNCVITDNILDSVDAPSALEEIDGDDRLTSNWAGPVTGNYTVGQVLTCTPLPGYTGSPSYQWAKDGVNIGGATSSTYTLVSGDTNAGVEIRCKVTGISYAGVTTGVGLKGNTMSNNVLINSSGTAYRYTRQTTAGTPPTNTDTTRTGNTTYTSVAAAASALGWSAPNRTMKSHLQALGHTVTSADGAQEYYNLATAMQRGQWNKNLLGVEIGNHIRTGRGMASVTL